MSKSLNPSELKNQIGRFKEAVRKVEVDESEAAFDEKLKAIDKKRQHSENPKKTRDAVPDSNRCAKYSSKPPVACDLSGSL